MSPRGERSVLRRSLISAVLLAALAVAGAAQAVHAGHAVVLDRSAEAARPAFATDDPADAPICALCLGIARTEAASVPPFGVVLRVSDATSFPPVAQSTTLAVAQPRAPAEPRAPPLAR